MIVLSGKQIFQKMCKSAWRTFTSSVEKEPYWRAKFPDRIASMDDIPELEFGYDIHRVAKAAEKMFKRYGYVVKEVMKSSEYMVHLFHPEDIRTVYFNDGPFPMRLSHLQIDHYRGERKHIYGSAGLLAGQSRQWKRFREIATSVASQMQPSKSMSEAAADYLIMKIRTNLNAKGEIDLLPWLNRWVYECMGVVAFNRPLNALNTVGHWKADAMVGAAALSEEIMHFTTMFPRASSYEERVNLLVEAQDFMYSAVRKYIDALKIDMELEPETEGVAQILLQNQSCSENDAITLILDLFQGASQTVPFTALMALYNLARHEDIQALAREEARQRMPKKDSKYFDVEGHEDYIESIVYETLRLNPPIIGNRRTTKENMVLGGYFIPRGTEVFLHFGVPCRQEENFREALKFMPGRGEYDKILPVFGGSSRMCIGKTFSLRHLIMIIAKLIRNFEFCYEGDEVEMENSLHNRPELPLILKLKLVKSDSRPANN